MNKKNRIWIYPLIIIFIGFIIINSCKKEDNSNTLMITVVTSELSDTAKNSIICGGTISSDPGITVIKRGVCWNKDDDGTLKPDTLDFLTEEGAGIGVFTSMVTGLDAGTKYSIRAYAIYYVNEDTLFVVKVRYGNIFHFTTFQEEIITSPVTSRTQNSIVCGGNITTASGTNITARGICWSTEKNPTIANDTTINGEGLGSFSSNMAGLIPNTTYYIRAYASDAIGTSYGNEISGKTFKSIVTDIDGNIYNTISIGKRNRVWMVENLKTTKYNDGTPIIQEKDNLKWNQLSTPAYCWYSNDEARFKNSYGALYNWYAVNTAILCPDGWSVPTDEEWTELTGLQPVSLEVDARGFRLKEPGSNHWINPSSESITNQSGFTGLPGGGRNYVGSFDDLGLNAYWWSSSSSDAKLAWFRNLYDNGKIEKIGLDKRSGISVRCIENEKTP